MDSPPAERSTLRLSLSLFGRSLDLSSLLSLSLKKYCTGVLQKTFIIAKPETAFFPNLLCYVLLERHTFLSLVPLQAAEARCDKAGCGVQGK